MRSEVGVGDVDVGGFDGDAHLTAFVDVFHYVVGAAGDGGEQRGHELYGIVRFQVGSVIGEQRVGGGVRFVEAVAGELGHEIENLFDLFRWEFALGCAFDEALTLCRHFFGLLFTHCPAQQIGFSERVARQLVRCLHHLFLINEDAQRLL